MLLLTLRKQLNLFGGLLKLLQWIDQIVPIVLAVHRGTLPTAIHGIIDHCQVEIFVLDVPSWPYLLPEFLCFVMRG